MTIHRDQLQELAKGSESQKYMLSISIISKDDWSNKFLEACQNGQLESVRNFMQKKKGGNINVKDNDGNNGFGLACKYGQVQVVIYLATINAEQRNIHLDNENNEGETGLYLACSYGHLDVVKSILERSKVGSHTFIDIGRRNYQNQMETPFIKACAMNHFEIVKTMIGKATKTNSYIFNAVDSQSETAFHHACRANHQDVIDLLMKHANKIGLDLDYKNKKRQTGYDLWKKADTSDQASTSASSEEPKTKRRKVENESAWIIMSNSTLNLQFYTDFSYVHNKTLNSEFSGKNQKIR